MIYTLGNIPQQHITKQYYSYTHHNIMLVHNGLAAVICGKSLIYNQCFFCDSTLWYGISAYFPAADIIFSFF